MAEQLPGPGFDPATGPVREMILSHEDNGPFEHLLLKDIYLEEIANFRTRSAAFRISPVAGAR